MRQSVRRWMFGAGTLGVVGAAACSQAAVAGAVQVAPAGHEGRAAAASTYKPPTEPLHFGQHGQAVRSVQQRLAELHYYPGPIDGKYGQDMQEAAWAFREVQGLRVSVRTEAEPITKAFEHALIHPKKPWVLVKHGARNRVEVNQNIQVLVLYKNNQPVLIAHVSTGGRYYYPCPHGGGTCGPAVTPDGNYHAIWFYSGWLKVPLGTMYNPVFFIGSAYAIHGDVPVPWFPASHGCIRIWMDIAPWFHKDLTIGGRHATRIYVRGTAPAYPASS
jgi:peptidoglycan hydrolase-like protein with peptidoglycan-binding domain